jgi:hypothetical protein
METTISINGNERMEVVWAGDKTTAIQAGTRLLSRGFAVKVYDSGFGIWVAEGIKMINQPETKAQRTVYDVAKIAGMFYTETELEILNSPVVWNKQTGVEYMDSIQKAQPNDMVEIEDEDGTLLFRTHIADVWTDTVTFHHSRRVYEVNRFHLFFEAITADEKRCFSTPLECVKDIGSTREW